MRDVYDGVCGTNDAMIGDRPATEGGSVLMRGDNVSAVSWVNRCGGSRDRRAGLLMRLLGRMEIASGWCHVAKHIPGVENTLADGISRWEENTIQDNVTRLTQDHQWNRIELGGAGTLLVDTVLQPTLPAQSLDEYMWETMTGRHEQ